MTTTAVRQSKLVLVLDAYGMELRLWKETEERKWGATLRDEGEIVQSTFEEDNLTLAKLHLLGEARSRAITRSGNQNLPGCDTFNNSWKVTRI